MARFLKTNLPANLLKTTPRHLSNKLDSTATTHLLGPPEIAEEEPEQQNSTPSVRYSVCRDRTAAKKFVFTKNKSAENDERKMAGVAEHQDINDSLSLGPKLPSDQSQVDANSSTNHQEGYRNFAVSTTYKNVVLPLKSSKLAPPFPEPVKVMPSHTVSDQEKAEQMLAEKRVPVSVKKARSY